MPFEWFLAIRHLVSRKRRALVSIIAAISVLGVIVGVTALVVVLAVVEGAQQDYFAKLIDQYAHIEVRGADGDALENYERVMEIVAEDRDVLAVAPMIKRYAMLKLRADSANPLVSTRPAAVLGIDPERQRDVSALGDRSQIIFGDGAPDDGEIVLGSELAAQMHLAARPRGGGQEWYWWAAGAKILALTPASFDPDRRPASLRLVGVFEAGLFDIDSSVAYTSLKTSQQMHGLEGRADLVHARLKNAHEAPRVRDRLAERLHAELGEGLEVRSWGEMNPEFFRALRLERLAMFVIVSLVVVVAALNIVGTLLLIAIEKTREIGILRAMGASRRSIRRLFLAQGLFVGLVGTGCGVALGLVLCYVLANHVHIEMPAAVYGLEGLPVLVKPLSVLTVALCSMGVCLLASVVPAALASRLDIVEALRHD